MAISTPVATTQQPSVAAALRDLIQGYWATQAVYAAAKLGIADLLRDGPQHPYALARLAGAHPSALVRVLRLLASHGLFAEEADGRFPHPPPRPASHPLPQLVARLCAEPAALVAIRRRSALQRADGRPCI